MVPSPLLGIDAYERSNAPVRLIDAAVSVLDGYEEAWNPREPGEVGAPFSADTERVDTLLDSGVSGRDAIEAYAAAFFGWYPDAEFVRGSDCAIEMAIVLTARDGLIIGEEVFWGGESLISCGWAV